VTYSYQNESIGLQIQSLARGSLPDNKQSPGAKQLCQSSCQK